MSGEFAKRFYKETGVFEDAAGFGVTLDIRALKTPTGALFRAPTRALAEACAAEWGAQGEHIIPASMPLSQLAFAAIESNSARRGELIDHVAKFAETDLCCYRADTPAALAARQAAVWDLPLAIGAALLGVRPPVVVGVIRAEIDPAFVAAMRAAAAALDDFRLTALAHAAGLAGSSLIALALIAGELDAAGAYAAATADEHWALERWGEDEDARARLDRLRAEFQNIARFVACLS
jgi:chaperone required for assembly of F1-ATPase